MKSALRVLLVLAVAGLAGCVADRDQKSGKETSPSQNSPIRCEIRLPKTWEGKLDNGLRIVIVEDHRLPKVTFRLLFPGAGGFYDPAGKEGLASLTALAMQAGTTGMDRRRISRLVERKAASVYIDVKDNGTDAVLKGDCFSSDFREIFDLAADIVLHPSLPQNEIAGIKAQSLSWNDGLRYDRGALAESFFLKALYGDHPGSRISCPPASVNALTQEDLAAFHRSRYVPGRAVLGIAGDITADEALRMIKERLSAWSGTGAIPPEVPEPPSLKGARIQIIHYPRSIQTILLVGTRGVSRSDPDSFRLKFLNQILGSNSSRRLNQNIREKHSYSFGCYSHVNFPDYPGVWRAETNVKTEWAEAALREILFEIDRIRNEKIGAGELETVKRMTIGEQTLLLESPDKVLDRHLMLLKGSLPEDAWSRDLNDILKISIDDVQATARKYLAVSGIRIVAVGDADKLEGPLGKFGSLEILDRDGRPRK